MPVPIPHTLIRATRACALFLITACAPPPLGEFFTVVVPGTASMGTPLRASTVVVTPLDAAGEQIAIATTDDDGIFQLDLSAAPPGPGLACLAGGAYVDPTTNAYVPLGTLTMCAIVLDLTQPPTDLAISPWTHLAVTYARQRASATTVPIVTAYAQARDAINAFLRCTDPTQNVVEAIPVDPTEAPAAPSPTELHAGVLLGALSSQAVLVSQDLRYTPGIRFTSVRLVDGYARDIAADGVFDGAEDGAPLTIEGYAFTSQSFRSSGTTGFVQGLRHFLEHERNATGLTVADMTDILDCMATFSSPPFADGGSTPDFQGPIVVFDLKATTVVSAVTDVCATVTDDSGVDRAAFEPPVDDTTFVDDRLCAAWNTTDYPDGDHQIVISALDTIGNSTRETLDVVINNGGPFISLSSPAEDAPLQGTVTFTFRVTDDDGVDAVSIKSPLRIDARELGDDTWDANLDTTTLPDGELVLTVDAVDALGRASQEDFVFINDNLEPGVFSGCVFADSNPFAGAAIAACLLTLDGCSPLQTSAAADQNGCFVLPLPDSVEGLVQVRARGGSYLDGSTGALVISGTFSGWTHTFPYLPTEDGTVVEHRSMNAWTTFADAWALARATDRTYATLQAAVAASYRLHGDHLGLSLADTYARDLVPQSTSSHTTLLGDDSTRLGLSLVGLSQQATSVALENGQPRDAANTLTLARVILRSAGSGLHDGLDPDGQSVSLFATTFNANSLLRKGHADAIAAWLSSGRNEAGLTLDSYGGSSGMLNAIALNPEPLLFGNRQPVAIDTTKPMLKATSPVAGMILAGSVDIEVSIADDVDISGATVTLVDTASGDILDTLNGSLVYEDDGAGGEDVTRATLSAHFESSSYADGDVTILVEAADAAGNVGTVPIPITLANNAPVIDVPADIDTPLSGVVAQLRICAGGVPMGTLELLEPVGLTTSVDVETSTRACLVISNVDTTTTGVDGPLSLLVQATSSSGVSSQRIITYAIDNLAPGSIAGCVFADSDPFRAATVTACLLELDGCVTIGGQVTADSNGCFELALPDNIAGLVQVRAKNGSYLDASTGSLVASGTFAGWTATTPYRPSAAGTHISHFGVHAWTSIADEWALARARDGTYETLPEAVAASYQLHGDHLGVSLADTYARDLVPESDSAHADLLDDDSTRLGLSLVGLSQQATNVALQNGQPQDAANALTLARVILRSAGSGLHDGLDPDGQSASLFATTFNANSLLRKGHADAIAAWLMSTRNDAGLTVDSYTGPGGMLTDIALNSERLLFGDLEPLPFDIDPPAVSVALLDSNGATVDTTPLNAAESVWLYATATDPSGFRSSTGTLIPPVPTILNTAGQPQPAEALGAMELLAETADTLSVRWPLRKGQLADGQFEASVRASDAVGNISEPTAVTFTVDLTPPAVGLAVVYSNADLQLVAGQTFLVNWTQADATSTTVTLGVERSLDGGATVVPAMTAITEPAQAGTGTVDLGACDIVGLVRAYAVDAAGNRGQTPWQTARCDASAPDIILQPSDYRDVSGASETFIPATQQYTRGRGAQVDVRRDWPDAIDFVIWHDEYYNGSPAVPVLKFWVGDGGAVSTPTNQLEVWYTYRWASASDEEIGTYTSEVTAPPATGLLEVRLEPDGLGGLATNTALPSHIHEIRLYARDLSGHVKELVYSWRFAWGFGSVYVDSCALRADVTAATLASGGLEAIYDGGDHALVDFWAYWPSYAGRDPPSPLALWVRASSIRSETTALVDDKVNGEREHNVARTCPSADYHKFLEESSCRSGYLADEIPDNSTPKPTADHTGRYAVDGGALSSNNTLLIEDARGHQIHVGGRMRLWYAYKPVFTSDAKYATGRYALDTKPGFDEVLHYMGTFCVPNGGACVPAPRAVRDPWDQKTYVKSLRLRLGLLQLNASLTLGSDSFTQLVHPEVVRLTGCWASSYVHTTTAP